VGGGEGELELGVAQAAGGAPVGRRRSPPAELLPLLLALGAMRLPAGFD